jgi:hypothetical protein
MGITRSLSKKYEGTGQDNSTGGRSDLNTHSPAEFAAAGQDATVLVILIVHYRGDANSKKHTYRSPHFLSRSALYTLQMLPLSKYVYFNPN